MTAINLPNLVFGLVSHVVPHFHFQNQIVPINSEYHLLSWAQINKISLHWGDVKLCQVLCSSDIPSSVQPSMFVQRMHMYTLLHILWFFFIKKKDKKQKHTHLEYLRNVENCMLSGMRQNWKFCSGDTQMGHYNQDRGIYWFAETLDRLHHTLISDVTWVSLCLRSPALDCLFNNVFRLTRKDTQKIRITGSLWGESMADKDPVIRTFDSMWWRHDGLHMVSFLKRSVTYALYD